MSLKLFSCYRIKVFSSLFVCSTFIFIAFTVVRYIRVQFTFGLLDCVRYNEDFAISRFVNPRFCSLHFTVSFTVLIQFTSSLSVFLEDTLKFVEVHQKFFKHDYLRKVKLLVN